jgi:hypothetical protein
MWCVFPATLQLARLWGNTRKKLKQMAPTHEIDQELVKLNQSYEPIFKPKN